MALCRPSIRPNAYLSVKPFNPIPSARKSRSTGKRARTGCRTCKQRRVKCDETKPAYSNCERYGRKCGGYEEHLLIHARQFTMPHKAGYFAAGFWSHLVSRLCNEAVESAFRALAMSQVAEGVPNRCILEQYSSAIDSLNKVVLRDGFDSIEATMACSLAFASLEALLGDNKAATKHVVASLKLYAATKATSISKEFNSISAVAPDASDSDYCIWRLACELEITLTDLAEDITPEIDARFLDEINSHSWHVPPDLTFVDAEHALMVLMMTRRRLRCLMRHAAFLGLDPANPHVSSDFAHQHRRLNEVMQSLKRPYEAFLFKYLNRHAPRDVSLVKLGYLTQVFIMDHMFSKMQDDEHFNKQASDILTVVCSVLRHTPSIGSEGLTLSSARNIAASEAVNYPGPERPSKSAQSFEKGGKIQLEKAPSYCMDSAMVPCLFHISKVAPSLQIRQRAIDILSKMNAVEGILSSRRCAKVAKKLLDADLSDLALAINTSRRDKLGTVLPVDVDQQQAPSGIPAGAGGFLLTGGD